MPCWRIAAFTSLSMWRSEPEARYLSASNSGKAPFLGLFRRLFRAIAQAQHQQGIGQTRDTQPDAALVRGLLRLLRQGEAAGIDDIVHHPHGGADKAVKRGHVHRGGVGKRILNQRRQVDRA